MKIGDFLHFLCGFLAVTSLSAVPLYADENEFTTSASNWDGLIIILNKEIWKNLWKTAFEII